MKEKLTVRQQIDHMKQKGISFDLISEEDAARYLETSTYYFKLKAFAKNYAKYQTTEKQGQYVNLDFAYLKDLATIDMHLRHCILKISTDLEHKVKVRFLNDFNNSQDDGYRLLNIFFNERQDIKDKILSKRDNSYTTDLIDKLEVDGFALWNTVEVLSLSDFLQLYRRFYEEYPDALAGINLYYPMQAVRKLRNAAAHNNCLINSLRKPYGGKIKWNSKVDSFINSIPTIGKASRKGNRSNQVIYDFVTMIYLIDELMDNPKMKHESAKDLYELFHGRMLRNKEFYKKESSITSAYQFCVNVVDFLYNQSYNSLVI